MDGNIIFLEITITIFDGWEYEDILRARQNSNQGKYRANSGSATTARAATSSPTEFDGG